MTGVALHLLETVRALVLGNIQSPGLAAGIAAHELGARRFLIIVARAQSHAVLDEMHSPFEAWSHEGALVQLAITPFETFASIWVAQQAQGRTGRRRCVARRPQGAIGFHRAVAVHSTDLNGLRDLSI